MNIIPELNLNKNFKDIKNGCIIRGHNIAIDNDTGFIRNDNSIELNDYLNTELKLHKKINKEDIENKIIHACPTQTEIIFFTKKEDEQFVKIFRYNETTNEISEYGKIDYNNGEIVTTFTYNKGHLIISIAEYNCPNGHKAPLRVIDLDDAELSQSPVEGQSNPYHSICPEVLIPNCSFNIMHGTAIKGWYYVFVRYKINNNNYTQWFNTNGSIFLDTYNDEYIEKYFISKNNNIEDTEENKNTFKHVDIFETAIKTNVSNNTELCNNTFKCILNNLDDRYDYYQIGFVIVSKTYSKCYISNDYNINNNEFIFTTNNLKENSIESIIKSYFNYYNVKSIDTYNNQLYIGNYEEDNDNIDVSDIKVDLKIKTTNVGVSKVKPMIVDEDNSFPVTVKCSNGEKESINYTAGFLNENREVLIPLKSIPIAKCINFVGTDYEVIYDTLQFCLLPDKVRIIAQTSKTGFKNYVDDINNFYVKISKNNNIVPEIYIKKDNVLEKVQSSINNLYMIANGKYDTLILKFDPIDAPTNFDDHYFIPYSCTYEYDIDDSNVEESIEVINNEFTNVNNSLGIASGEWYNFFIHFVNKYGEITRGYNLNKFVVNDLSDDIITKISNKNLLIKLPILHFLNTKYNIDIKLDKLPSNYIGYFVSYEKVDKFIKFRCIGKLDNINGNKYTFKLYNDYIYSFDKIDFNFEELDVYETNNKIKEGGKNKNPKEDIVRVNDKINTFVITNKKLTLPDTYNNLGNVGYIEIEAVKKEIDEEDEENESVNIAKSIFYSFHLRKSDDYINEVFGNKSKTLIPCSNICYNINTYININTKNKFISNAHATFFFKNTYWNAGEFNFKELIIKADSTTDNKLSINNSNYSIVYPFYIINFKDEFDIPIESLTFNNKPVIQIFPIEGLNTTNDKTKSFAGGYITEIKNFIDLYKQPQVSYVDLYPKPNYNFDEENINYIFSKTIRRSNIIQDESKHIGWRFFETENYKNINENKGDIVKLVGVGNNFLIHTEHSIFRFNADNTIKATEGDIALASQNIWDVNYQELTSSKLGHYGLYHEKESIIGSFGYVFYDKVENKFYRFDNNSFGQIDEHINQYIQYLNDDNTKLNKVRFINDEKRNRLLIVITYKDRHEKILIKILSYNYKTNTFVSFHEYDLIEGYNTKSNLYLISRDDCELSKFNEYKYGEYIDSNSSSITILINDSFDIIKCLDSISYKVNKESRCEVFNYFDNAKDTYYSGKYLTIFTNLCNTKEIDIEVDQTKLNSIEEYDKPYWELGNWNFNLIRDKIVDYLGNKLNAENSSRVFGNWFGVQFRFVVTENQDKIELEFLDYKLSNHI